MKSLTALFVLLLSSVTALLAKPVSAVDLRIELDRSILPAASTERAIIKVIFEGVRLPRPDSRAPVNLALVLDRSGSMSGEKLEQAKGAALEALRRLASDDIFSLVTYDTEIETLIPAQRVGDGNQLELKIRAITARGMTALYGGVTQGAAELRKNLEDKRFTHRLILLSDGQANRGPSTADDLGRLGAALMKEGISVTTIGLGLGYNEDLMASLAQKSDGNTYFVEASEDLPRIFAAELGDVLNVVARRVVLTVDFPEGVRPLRLIGRDGMVHGQSAEVTLNQLYGGQEKFALFEVEIASTQAGSERDVARAKIEFEDAATQRIVIQEGKARVSFSSDQSAVRASANHKVQADYATNAIAVTRDDAVGLVDKGQREEAAKMLRTRASELATLGSAYGNAAVLEVAQKNAAEADRLEKEGLSNSARKAYRAENAQTKSQQSSK